MSANQTSLYAALTLAMSMIVGGCNSDTSVIGGTYDEARAYPKITLSQDTLQPALGFQEPVVTRTSTNLMSVTVPVRARSNEDLNVEYRIIWFDANHQPIRPEGSWMTVRLEPRQPTSITVTSSSTDAVDYNLQFRWARP
ncbi:MAG: DUF1425 domain-containing protein [Planctomycetes bacterium]|nr:DUF1425 domain-containing protein [Planctomycetota bacterium]